MTALIGSFSLSLSPPPDPPALLYISVLHKGHAGGRGATSRVRGEAFGAEKAHLSMHSK